MNIEAKVFVSLLILLSAGANAQPVETHAEQQVEVVEVIGQRVEELRFQIEDARLDIYDLFNTLNTDDEFDVHCEARKVTGSLIKSTICEPAFVGMALENTARTAFLDRNANGTPVSSGIAPLVQGSIAQKNLQLRDKMVELANTDAALQSAILDLQELMAEYAEATDRSGVVAAATEGAVTQGLYNWIHTTGNADLSFPFYRDIFGFELENSTFATAGANTPPPTIRSRDAAGSDPLVWQLTDTEGSRFRTVFMGSPGIGFGLELSEFLDIPRDERHGNAWDPGNSILVLQVKDFGEVLRRLEAANTPVVTAGGQAIRLGTGDAIVVRDPDGYLVMVRSSAEAPADTDTAMVTDIDIGLSVASTADSLAFYRDLLQFSSSATITMPDTFLTLFGLNSGQLLQTTTRIPNTGIDVLLWEFDVADDVPVQPFAWRMQDVGAPQFQLQVRDLDDLLLRTGAAGYDFLSVDDKPIQRPFGRFVFVKDPNGVLVEYVEPAARQ